jgi:hypothetical protein
MARPEVTGCGTPELSAIELNRIIPLNEAVKLSSLSRDVWLRKYKDKIIRLSDQRLGVRVRDALFMTD